MSFKETAIAKLNEMKSGAQGIAKSTIADCITTLKWIPDEDAQTTADLKKELADERHRHDRYVDFELAEAEELGRFKQAQKDGLLLTLPCKIGDPVFVVGSKTRAGSMEAWVNSGRFRLTDLPKVGTTIFLNREDAEAAMREILNG